MDLNTDKMSELRRHSIFAPTGTGLNLFRWISKILDGLDQTLCQILKNHKNDQKSYLAVPKNSGKITKKLRRSRQPWLGCFLKMLWWSQVGHSRTEAIADLEWLTNSGKQVLDFFFLHERVISLWLFPWMISKTEHQNLALIPWQTHNHRIFTEKSLNILLRMY